MVRVQYTPLVPSDLQRLQDAASALRQWQMKVRPSSGQYLVICRLKDDLNALAAEVGAEPFFPRGDAPGAYPTGRAG